MMKISQNNNVLTPTQKVKAPSKKQIFISWTKYQRRVESMKQHFEFDTYYLGENSHVNILKLLFYIKKSIRTLILLFKENPDVIWIQLPPTFIIYPTYFFFLFKGKKPIVLADCHNAQLREPWIKFPFLLWIINQFDKVIVHNKFIETVADELGFNPSNLMTLETRPAIVSEYFIKDSRE